MKSSQHGAACRMLQADPFASFGGGGPPVSTTYQPFPQTTPPNMHL